MLTASDNYPWAGPITAADMQPKEGNGFDPDGYQPKTEGRVADLWDCPCLVRSGERH